MMIILSRLVNGTVKGHLGLRSVWKGKVTRSVIVTPLKWTDSSRRHLAHRVSSEEEEVRNKYQPMIGLEIHAQISSERKLFSGSLNSFEALPNTNVTKFDAGHPGTLPLLNPECVKKAIKLILGLGGEVQLQSSFERKHYFYPDLPLGYQITQHHSPIGLGGELVLGKTDLLPYERTIRIQQVQLEQDTATLSDLVEVGTGINLNRAGAGLLEVVTYPDFTNSLEAASFLLKLQALLRRLGVSDGNMEEGSLRCDVNVSVRLPGDPPGTRCELKNLHTPKIVQAAVDYEIQRQIDILESGEVVAQQTRGYDVTTKKTTFLRSKETAPDYRYMPEPDVPILHLQPHQIQQLRTNLPELPDQIYDRWLTKYQLKPTDINVLLREPGAASFFDEVVVLGHSPQLVVNWITTTLFGILASRSLSLTSLPLTPPQFSSILTAVTDRVISGNTGKQLLTRMVEGDPRLAPTIIQAESLASITDPTLLRPLLLTLIQANPQRASLVLTGDTRATSWFQGQIMRATKGKADPTTVQELLLTLAADHQP